MSVLRLNNRRRLRYYERIYLSFVPTNAGYCWRIIFSPVRCRIQWDLKRDQFQQNFQLVTFVLILFPKSFMFVTYSDEPFTLMYSLRVSVFFFSFCSIINPWRQWWIIINDYNANDVAVRSFMRNSLLIIFFVLIGLIASGIYE